MFMTCLVQSVINFSSLVLTLVCVCSYYCTPGVSVCYVWQWPEQRLCCGCGRPEDQLVLC